MPPAKPDGPDIRDLFAAFPNVGDLPEFQLVSADEVPEPYHRLLVHEAHMTVTVEAHHGGPVDVQVLDRRREGDLYSRKILLLLQSTDCVVQFGIVRIHLDLCGEAVREEILRERTPLGRILINYNVLRRIEPTAYLRVTPNTALKEWFGLARPEPTYGRLGIIHCDGRPAIELLEIVRPEET